VLQRLRDRYAAVAVSATGHLGDHAQLAWLALDRAEACVGRRLRTDDAVVLLAHGSPYNDANEDIERAAARLRGRDIATTVGYMELNRPTIADAVAGALAAGSATVVAVPFFLHLGRHVKHDLPGLMGGIQRRYHDRRVLLSAHLGYDARLTTVVQDRVLAHGLPGCLHVEIDRDRSGYDRVSAAARRLRRRSSHERIPECNPSCYASRS